VFGRKLATPAMQSRKEPLAKSTLFDHFTRISGRWIQWGSNSTVVRERAVDEVGFGVVQQLIIATRLIGL
jgi:hypothetical protein